MPLIVGSLMLGVMALQQWYTTHEPGKDFYLWLREGLLAGITAVSALEKRGVRRAEGGADVEFTVKAAGPFHREPGSFGLAGSYQPALISSIPIAITSKEELDEMVPHGQKQALEQLNKLLGGGKRQQGGNVSRSR